MSTESTLKKYYRWADKLPDKTLDVYEPYHILFWRTMYERHMIWCRRFEFNQPRPWTDDPILRDNKFTNVYRELDRNSQWLIRNVILDKSLGLRDLIWKMMLFRFYNNPATFAGYYPRWSEWKQATWATHIAAIREAGDNPYTSAYLINSMAAPGHSRDYCYSNVVVPMLHENIGKIIKTVLSAASPTDIIRQLKTLPAVADFIAHEFYQDFTYIPRYTGRRFMRWGADDYTNVGPGASIGIRLIYPSLTGSDQQQAIYRLRDEAASKLAAIGEEQGVPMAYLYFDRSAQHYTLDSKCNITLHQVEMWLCEFQKYWKMTIGLGKQRSKFTPTSTTTL